MTRFRRLTGRKGGKAVKKRRPSVPPRERALVGILLLNVVWLAYALGGVRLWGELGGLALSLGSLLLLPKWKEGEMAGSSSPVFRLLKLPLFWCGLALYTYFFIQSWNVSWEWVVYNGNPVMRSRPPRFDWLPTGIVSPLDENNPLRAMTFYTIPWLACCSAWAGLSTRRAVNLLLHGMAIIGVVFAFIALRQHFLGLDRILGIFPTAESKLSRQIPFWGTLVNENHAAFFLILANGLCLGLFLSGWHRDLRLFKKGGGIWLLYLGLSLLTTFAVLMAQARGATGFVALQWLLFVVFCSIFFIRRFGIKGMLLPGIFGIIVLGITTSFVINPDVFERQKREWIRTFNLVENPELEARYYMMQVTTEMIDDAPLYGHGAGSWRYLHLPYLAKYPEFNRKIVRLRQNQFTGKFERHAMVLWYQNAHVDLLEYLVEWGVVGCLFPLLAGLWLLYRGIRSRHGWDLGLAVLLMTVMVVFLGAAMEFHFRIPLVLLMWCLLFTLTIKLVELNDRAA